MKLLYQGKVRDIYEVDDKRLLIVATDRISCFDCVLPTLIPGKGKILTKISLFWFEFLKHIIENHLICADINVISEFIPFDRKKDFEDRVMLVKKAKRINIECVVRGYLSGSAWREYKEKESVCGIKLPEGLKESEKLPEVIFTPSTKAEKGEHDINISEAEAKKIVSSEIYELLKEKSILLYKTAYEYAYSKGIIIADTKFEFGIFEDRVILIDEVLTPDSSRFWDATKYDVGKAQENFDKQYVRDYLISVNWQRCSITPSLPDEVVQKTIHRYTRLQELICTKTL